MSEIVIVYELDQPVADAQRRPHRVHAAPAAPDRPDVVGPRTLCGRDTFAMARARSTPPGVPGTPWYPVEYASVVCPDCDAVMEI
ncbi:hypothetical protein ACIGXF_00490 [Streptomyces sp. NPDC053086]|uniref:hypothetical protein n=1 Tax=unclassified Streptomyces TaxID=2593676 RepID=UPI0036F5BB78